MTIKDELVNPSPVSQTPQDALIDELFDRGRKAGSGEPLFFDRHNMQVIVEKHFVASLQQAQATIPHLQASLEKIKAGHPAGDCGCEHDDPNCCATVGEWCAVCIAAKALAALLPTFKG
jgi:hypothetical protein